MIRWATFLLLLLSCGPEDIDPNQIIEERASEQVAAIRANLLRDCNERILEAAQVRADSLLLDRARRMRRIAGRPPRPGRPGEPPPQELSEPLPLRPLFPFEIRFDTLLRDSLLRDSLLRDSLLQLNPIDTLLRSDSI
ncbi:hypothetical protein CLV84_0355 [Neolewinella xylanilytica]|uniref:Uncharacterized protein n=1 Tax=Neolewinella xylanilytica TaxID=1514080 RepID=A0A2S6I7D3_9BACT|nr:hypothetical protein [Neolewinella xylanilytica]PPK87415.1 hypothetical protein CLV84_0355 [Neolewinella xylanilytica]